MVTGKPCILCGGSRAVISLLSGNLPEAFRMNGVVVLLIAFLFFYLVLQLLQTSFHEFWVRFHPRTLSKRFGDFLQMHWSASIVFGLFWWAWNIARWQ